MSLIVPNSSMTVTRILIADITNLETRTGTSCFALLMWLISAFYDCDETEVTDNPSIFKELINSTALIYALNEIEKLFRTKF